MRMIQRPSSDIPVRAFGEILIWPFRLDVTAEKTTERIQAAVSGIAAGLGPNWRQEKNPLRHLDPGAADPSADAYAEFVYFHPFIRKFLYDDTSSLLLFRRDDIRSLQADFGTFRLSLSVERCLLYLFPATGNAVLALELAAGAKGEVPMVQGDRPLSLAHVMDVLERLRRAYPPFWVNATSPGLSPVSVHWLTGTGERLDQGEDLTLESAARWVHEHRCSPLSAHWRALLAPLRFDGDGDCWTHVVDERIPLMAWLAVEDPHTIGLGDWVRLAMLDGPDDAELPYGRNHLDGFEGTHCYDAFWDPGAGKTTRYLMSGYGFVAVGSADDEFFTNVVRTHMRRHYFQLGLIAHFQIAALLTLSERLSRATELSDNHAKDLQQAALDFTHRLWFPDVSNHVQGRELFIRWRRFLSTETLYDQVMREAQDHNAFRNACADRDAADAASNLNLIATLGLALSLAAGILGMNVLIPNRGDGINFNWKDIGIALATLAVVMAPTGLCLVGLGWKARNGRLRTVGGLLFAAAMVLWMLRGVNFVS
jgi:hypothetical protein